MRGRSPSSTGERAFQGSFRWHQHADALDLAVRGPAAGVRLEVERHADALTVTARGDTRVLRIPRPSSRSCSAGGCPSASLHAWLLGFPDPASTRDEAGHRRHARFDRAAALARRVPTYQLAPASSETGRRRSCRAASISTYGDLRWLTIDDWHAAPLSAVRAPIYNIGWGVAKW